MNGMNQLRKNSEPIFEKYARPKKKPRLKPGRSIAVSAEDKARYEALINSKDTAYDKHMPEDRRKK